MKLTADSKHRGGMVTVGNRSGDLIGPTVDRYLARLRARGLAANTLRSRELRLGELVTWAKANNKHWVKQIDVATLESYLFDNDGLGVRVSASTFNHALNMLSGFFDWCVATGIATVNPVREIPRKRVTTTWVPLILGPAELGRILDMATNPRDRALMAVAINTGLRASDIFPLRVGAVNLESGFIQTKIRKTGKQDVKPITRDLERELTAWLTTYAQVVGMSVANVPNEWALFPRLGGGYSLRSGFTFTNPTRPAPTRADIVTRILDRMGLPSEREGFHTLRRSSARALFEALQEDGASRDRGLLIVKDFLNHSSTTMTEKYLGLAHERKARDDFLRGKSFLGGGDSQGEDERKWGAA